MGSIVITDVVHRFPHPMFGAAHPHRPAQESSAAPMHHKPASGRYSQPENHYRTAAAVDTPMTDAAPHATSSAAAGYRPQQQQQQQRSSLQLAPPGPSPAQQSQYPPRSPRLKGHSSQSRTPTPAVSSQSLARRSAASTASTSSSTTSFHGLRSPAESATTSPLRIKVQSLSHIQSFATDESSPFSQTRSLSRRGRRDPNDVGPQYEISSMPVTDIIEMVAGLLTKITTTNDRQHEHLHRQIPTQDGASGFSQQTASVLAFHGKNIPSISILSYLSRIHKYCPTTYEVFLALLVYFDRMTERVNSGPLQSLRQANQQSAEAAAASANPSCAGDGSRHSSVSSAQLTNSAHSAAVTNNASPNSVRVQAATPPPSGSLGKPRDNPIHEEPPPSPPQSIHPALDCDPYNLSHFFVVDSFNIHRLVIAGVTCASKFFSDIFYTNSRYAKVGGLPLVELNHLELQFLILNDFRLSVPLEEMEAYGTMLVEFYAREVAAQQLSLHGSRAGHSHSSRQHSLNST